jgi:hypothetical protein
VCSSDLPPEPDATASSIWAQVLEQAAAKSLLVTLMARVLHDQSGQESYPGIARLLDGLIASPAESGGGPGGRLEAISTPQAGLAVPSAYIQAQIDLTWRTAVIKVKGQVSGAGFLVGEDLLLTAGHVIEAGGPKSIRPGSIVAVFDFEHQPGVSYAETGTRVAVTDIICYSPPTQAEREETWGEDWEASEENLDYALLRLESHAPVVHLGYGMVRPRGYYILDPEPNVFSSGITLILAHYPVGGFLAFSPVLSVPRFNNNGTRIRYKCNTLVGSSGGPIMNTSGKVVAIHHYASRRENQGVPISTIRQNLANRDLGHLFDAQDRGAVAYLGEYSQKARQEVCQGITDDLHSIVSHLAAPASIGDAYALWDWLSSQRRLYKLRGVLEILGYTELTRILDDDLLIVDEVRMADIKGRASQLVQSMQPARRARTPEALLGAIMGSRIITARILTELTRLPSLQDHPRLQLHWRMKWSSQFQRAEDALGELSRELPADRSQARRAIHEIEDIIEYAGEAESAISALHELALSPALYA